MKGKSMGDGEEKFVREEMVTINIKCITWKSDWTKVVGAHVQQGLKTVCKLKRNGLKRKMSRLK